MHAQTPLPLGMLNTVGTPSSCSSGSGFYYYVYPNTGLALNMSCTGGHGNGLYRQHRPWAVTIGYLNPVGVVPTVTVANGLSNPPRGAGGTTPESYALADAYFRAGYEVVQVVWADDWQMVYDPFPITTPPTYGNIQAAACPAPRRSLTGSIPNLFLTNCF